ncbi:hypothetical protein QFZ68_002112 [Streptomyces sp. V1I6]|nr:hypothetical protein [Streptomyces sp. V1I6]
MTNGPRHFGGALVVDQRMDERVPLVTVEELRKVVGLLLVWGSDDEDLAVEVDRVAHELALRLPAD